MKLKIVLPALVIVAALGAYGLSPFWAAYQLKSAAVSGDRDLLEQLVDFPAVKDGIKSQMTASMAAKLKGEAGDAANPFAALGTIMGAAIVEKVLDVVVTPDGLSAMIRSGKPLTLSDSGKLDTSVHKDNADTTLSYAYHGLDRFLVSVEPAGGSTKANGRLSLSFERRGVISWKLVRVDFPGAF